MSIRPAELPLPMCRDAKKERFQARCGKTGTRELGLNSLGSYLELECGAPTESPTSCWGAPGWWNHWSQMMGWPSLLTPVWQLGTYVGQPLWLVPAGLFFFFFLLCEKRSHCLALAVESAVSGRSHTAKLLCQVGPKNPSKTKQYMIQYCVYGVSGSS